MHTKLSICCVTKNEPHAHRFLLAMQNLAEILGAEFVIGADGCEEEVKVYTDKVVPVTSKGYIESILQEVFNACSGDYIFRLDDDELLSPELFEWFCTEKFSSRIYSFRRLELYGDENHFISHPLVYPSVSPRLTTKELAKCDDVIHGHFVPSYGTVIEFPILHHKFLLKTYEERIKLAKKYEAVATNAGLGTFRVWTLPEDVPGVLDTIKEIQ